MRDLGSISEKALGLIADEAQALSLKKYNVEPLTMSCTLKITYILGSLGVIEYVNQYIPTQTHEEDLVISTYRV